MSLQKIITRLPVRSFTTNAAQTNLNEFFQSPVELKRTLDELYQDDEAYKNRIREIQEIAFNYKLTDPEIPRVKYTEAENKTWGRVFNAARISIHKHACSEVIEALENMIMRENISDKEMPQLEDIS